MCTNAIGITGILLFSFLPTESFILFTPISSPFAFNIHCHHAFSIGGMVAAPFSSILMFTRHITVRLCVSFIRQTSTIYRRRHHFNTMPSVAKRMPPVLCCFIIALCLHLRRRHWRVLRFVACSTTLYGNAFNAARHLLMLQLILSLIIFISSLRRHYCL